MTIARRRGYRRQAGPRRHPPCQPALQKERQTTRCAGQRLAGYLGSQELVTLVQLDPRRERDGDVWSPFFRRRASARSTLRG